MEKKKKSSPSLTRLAAAALLAALLSAGPALVPLRADGLAFGQKGVAEREITGTVVAKAGEPISGAVVYIENTQTQAVKSYLTDKDGHFHFSNLSTGTDYDLWAEHNGKRANTKSISQFNSKSVLDFKLKLD